MFVSLITILYITICMFVFFLMIRRPPRSTLDRSSAASDVYKRQVLVPNYNDPNDAVANGLIQTLYPTRTVVGIDVRLSLIHISEPTRPY